jgi:hypothetical protein
MPEKEKDTIKNKKDELLKLSDYYGNFVDLIQ